VRVFGREMCGGGGRRVVNGGVWSASSVGMRWGSEGMRYSEGPPRRCCQFERPAARTYPELLPRQHAGRDRDHERLHGRLCVC